MITALHCFWIVLIITPATIQVSTPDDDSYVAAVVEYASSGSVLTEKPLDIIRNNFHNYEKLIREASEQNADIIVFPECGLTTMNLPVNRTSLRQWTARVPDPIHGEIPCHGHQANVSEILRNASCAASRYEVYVVINLSEEVPCDSEEDLGCPSDGVFIYNSNVVLDRRGTVIARYRKFNLFVEPGFDITSTAELTTFDTDFGVRFGTFICFDILFEKPPLQLVREQGITDFVYSTAWFSELPYLTASETQAGWAYALDVNLLASGFNNPANGNVGSGIYAGKLGPLEATMPSTRSSKLLVHRVPKKPVRMPLPPNSASNSLPLSTHSLPADPLSLSEVPTSTFSGIRFFQEDFRQFATKLLNTDSTQFTDVDVCDGDFCCHFEVSANSSGDSCASDDCGGYYYRLGSFNGVRNFAGTRVAGIQVCGIIPCTKKDDIKTCGKARDSSLPRNTVTFNSIFIRGDRFQRPSSLQMPMTLTESLLPLSSSEFHFTSKKSSQEDISVVQLNTIKTVDNLIGLAVYSRVFDRDGPSRPRPEIVSEFSVQML